MRLQYRHRHRPRVKVIDPVLETRPNESLPHIYPGEELCLYYPGGFEGSQHFIADTIIPWTSEWLYFYEHWMSTGSWLGTEAAHGPLLR